MTSVSSKPDTDVSAEIVCLAHLVVLGRTGAQQKTEPLPLNMNFFSICVLDSVLVVFLS
jgi:hypothetical protein